jgi:hypothetical protein
MARDTGLALPEHRAQLAHGEFAVTEQRQQAHPTGLGHALEGAHDLVQIQADGRIVQHIEKS